MYPDNTTLIYTNGTPRKSRIPGIEGVIVFGFQKFIKHFLIDKFDKEFFGVPWSYVENDYKFAIPVDTARIKQLHELGYLPLEIKALPEGMRCPIRVPCMTIKNTQPDFFWLTNYLETLISCETWQPMTSATIAAEYLKVLLKYSRETTGGDDFVQWQAHDFSMRGMSSVQSAILSGMGHLTSFTGTDTIPAIYAMRNYYRAEGLIGASVPATEHSVESMNCEGTMEGEYEHTKRLLKLYPTGIVSKVSDTIDLWTYITKVLPRLIKEVMARDGKLVIRPDSGDPVDIICGKAFTKNGVYVGETQPLEIDKTPEFKGVIELLWDTFGGTIVKGGDGNEYKQLDSHVGAIYGDSITIDRAREICERLKAKGFASTNIVFGVGSYTYQYNTRDTFGFAMKATYGEVIQKEYKTLEDGTNSFREWIEPREIWKDPITDDGTKKSAKGLLQVVEVMTPDAYGNLEHDTYQLVDQCSWEEERKGALQTIFLNGKLVKETTLEQVRARVRKDVERQLKKESYDYHRN